MGVKGLWQYVEHHNIIYQYPKDRKNLDRRKNGFSHALSPQHLLVDMNAIMHAAYSPKAPNTRATLQGVRAQVISILQRFRPTTTLVLCFDGVSPLAKLPEQKERRKGMSPQQPSAPPKGSATPANLDAMPEYTCQLQRYDVPMRQEEITTGSQFVCACEQFIMAELAALEAAKDPLVSWQQCKLSGCVEPGEGEVKIAQHIRHIYQAGVKDQSYSPDDSITIVGHDSDLIMVALTATPYRYITIADPTDYGLTCVNELLDHWSGAVPNPPLADDLLSSYRMDFVFIMLMSGCDYYDGLRQNSLGLWRTYRHLRANCGFFRRQLISGDGFTLDVEFLRKLTSREGPLMAHARVSKNKRATMKASLRGNTPGSAERGIELLRAALWNFKGYVCGQCADYEFTSSLKARGGEVSVGCLRAAVQRNGIAKLIGASDNSNNNNNNNMNNNEGNTNSNNTIRPPPPLSALEQCLCVLGVRARYSKEINITIDAYTTDNGFKLTTSQSASFLVPAVKEIMSHVDMRRLTLCEKYLHQTPQITEEEGDCPTLFLRYATVKPRKGANCAQEDSAEAVVVVADDDDDDVADNHVDPNAAAL